MADRPVTLAIETADRMQEVGLRLADGSFVAEPVDAAARDREDLVPAIDRLCGRCGVAPAEIGCVALNAGPGGFTGLRMAHAAAQAMGLSMGVKLVQVHAAAAAAECARQERVIERAVPVWVALACKGDEAWLGRMDPACGHDPQDGGSRTADTWDPGHQAVLLADEHLPEAFGPVLERLRVRRLPRRGRAEAVASVADRLLGAGRTVPPEALVPIYPREAEAVRLWRQRHATR
jgi:tRNA threonylcarbamoyladenosine biosynthesis protein TsaB